MKFKKYINEGKKPIYWKDIKGKDRYDAEKILRNKYGYSEARAAEKVALYTGAKSDKVIGEGNEIINKIAYEAGQPGAKLMSLRRPLESIFPKKDVDFVLSPVPHFRIKYKGKTIVLVNKKYADDAEETVNDIAIGYEGKI